MNKFIPMHSVIFFFACLCVFISPRNSCAESFFNQPELISSIGDQLNVADIRAGDAVYLDKDEFYLPTAKAAFLWNAVTNTLVRVSGNTADKLSRIRVAGVALEDGQIFAFKQNAFILWNRETKIFSRPMESRNQSIAAQVKIDNKHALICSGNKYDDQPDQSDVISVYLDGGSKELRWDSSPSLRPLLVRAGVVGTVEGFSKISRSEVALPVVFNANTCFWELKNPVYIYADGEKLISKDVVPYFLPDGRVLAFVQNRQAPKVMNQPLMWNPKKTRWEIMEPSFKRSDYQLNLVEMWLNDSGSIAAYDFEQPFIEFFDTKTLRWVRSKQTLPKGMTSIRVYFLTNGKALAVNNDNFSTGFSFLEPVREMQSGQLQYQHKKVVGLSDGNVYLLGARSEMINAATRISKVKKPLEGAYENPSLVEMGDGSVLLYAAKTSRCSLFTNPANCPNSLRYYPKQDRWEVVPDLNVPYQSPSLLRKNGDFIYLVTDTDASTLYRWHPGKSATPFTKLFQVRQNGELLELNDGRLVSLAGETAPLKIAIEKSCNDCADDFAPAGEIGPSQSTEIFDDASSAWRAGPIANYPAGRVVKLRNGNVFKLSQVKLDDYSSSRAEIADAAFTRWNRLPTLPVSFKRVHWIVAVGNRALIYGDLTDRSQQISMGEGLSHREFMHENLVLVWDDDVQQWAIWGNSDVDLELWKGADNIWPLPDGKQIFVYVGGDGYKIVSMPDTVQ